MVVGCCPARIELMANEDDSELERDAARLDTALAYLQRRLKTRLDFPDEEVEAVAATMALLRTMVAQAEAIRLLAKSEFAEAGSSNLRTIFEAWCDLRAILGDGDRNANGRRFRVFALLEFRDYIKSQVSESDDQASELADIENELEPYQRSHKDLVAQIEKEREKGAKLWSGKTRTAMLRALDAAPTASGKTRPEDVPTLVQIFKVLSWESHNILIGVLDVKIDTDEKGETRILFGHRQTQREAGAFNCAMAERMLGDSWMQVQRAFKIESRG